MVESSTSSAAAPARPERCCPLAQCAYTTPRVRAIVTLIYKARAFGFDAGEAASSALGSSGDGRSPGASAGSDTTRHAARVWDVQQAIAAGCHTVEAISARLCPFAADDER